MGLGTSRDVATDPGSYRRAGCGARGVSLATTFLEAIGCCCDFPFGACLSLWWSSTVDGSWMKGHASPALQPVECQFTRVITQIAAKRGEELIVQLIGKNKNQPPPSPRGLEIGNKPYNSKMMKPANTISRGKVPAARFLFRPLPRRRG